MTKAAEPQIFKMIPYAISQNGSNNGYLSKIIRKRCLFIILLVCVNYLPSKLLVKLRYLPHGRRADELL